MEHKFSATARALILGAELWVSGPGRAGHTAFDVVEVEFYLHSDEHPDTFTHCHPRQQAKSRWYFHRASRKPGSKYKAGTRKGLDVTRGGPGEYHGILLRAIRDQATGKLIEGPCNTVHAIMAAAGAETLYDLVDRMPTLSVRCKASPLALVKRGAPLEGALLCGPRIGLEARGDAAKEEYVARPYRFVLAGAGVKKKKTSLVPLSPLP